MQKKFDSAKGLDNALGKRAKISAGIALASVLCIVVLVFIAVARG